MVPHLLVVNKENNRNSPKSYYHIGGESSGYPMKNSLPISSESGIYHLNMHIDNLHKTMNIYLSVVTLKFFNNTTHEIGNSANNNSLNTDSVGY